MKRITNWWNDQQEKAKAAEIIMEENWLSNVKRKGNKFVDAIVKKITKRDRRESSFERWITNTDPWNDVSEWWARAER